MSLDASAVDRADEALGRAISDAERALWTLAALAVALRADASSVPASAADVLTAAGITPDELSTGFREQRAVQVEGSLLKATAIGRGAAQTWADQSDETLRMQGRMTKQGGAVFAAHIRALPGMADLLAEPGATILDVGTGVAGIAVALAEELAGVSVVGIDVLPRVLTLAVETVAASSARDRVELRLQSVADLDDVDRYTYAWMPAPFIPDEPLREGVRRVARALKPGGWMTLAHGRYTGDPLADAISRFQTTAFGGTALNNDEAEALLVGVGLEDPFRPPLAPGLPGMTFARRPTSS